MKSNTFETIVKPILVLAVICAIASALLAVTNGITAPVIAENDRITTLNAYLDVLPEGLAAEDLADVAVTTEGVASAVKTPDGCFAIKAAAKGFDGGLVTTILGFDADGNICGIWADCSTQTAGMGSKCADPAFTDQFVGLSGASALTLNVDVQQVSGSTVTSTAFVEAVNSAITCYNEVKGAA